MVPTPPEPKPEESPALCLPLPLGVVRGTSAVRCPVVGVGTLTPGGPHEQHEEA